MPFAPNEQYITPSHLATKPLAAWSLAELREQLESYEAIKQVRTRHAEDLTKADMHCVEAMQQLKLNMMAEMAKRLGVCAEPSEKTTTMTLGDDLLPKLERLTVVLDDYDPVTQQKLLELASARYAMRAGSMSGVVVAGMHKHIKQILKQK